MAAKHEFEEIESVDTARQLFQRALRILPNSEKLWTEVLLFGLVLKIRQFKI